MLHEADLITNDGIRLHYYDSQADKQPILAIPGIGGYAQMWLKAVELFRKQYRFIILDPRNQGLSARTYRGQRISRHAADLAELIYKLNLTNIIGIGNSMGAATLWAYVSLYGDSHLACLIDLDQPPKMINDSSWEYGFKELSWNNFPNYLKADFGSGIYAHIDDEMFALAKKAAHDFPYRAEDNFQCRIDHAEQDWRDVLLDLQRPMLILAGKNSPFFDYHFAGALAKMNSKIKASVVTNCGHLIQAEQPEIMYNEICNFLSCSHL